MKSTYQIVKQAIIKLSDSYKCMYPLECINHDIIIDWNDFVDSIYLSYESQNKYRPEILFYIYEEELYCNISCKQLFHTYKTPFSYHIDKQTKILKLTKIPKDQKTKLPADQENSFLKETISFLKTLKVVKETNNDLFLNISTIV